jgi:hypothetical protein
VRRYNFWTHELLPSILYSSTWLQFDPMKYLFDILTIIANKLIPRQIELKTYLEVDTDTSKSTIGKLLYKLLAGSIFTFLIAYILNIFVINGLAE